ncbi:MAG: hypothetical protein ACLRWP_08940 [Bilophila wadsworthia]
MGNRLPGKPCSGGKGWAWRGKRARRPRIRGGGRIRARFRRVGAAVQGYGGGAVSEEENIRLVREIGEVKAELRAQAEVAGTNQRLDDIVITQLRITATAGHAGYPHQLP